MKGFLKTALQSFVEAFDIHQTPCVLRELCPGGSQPAFKSEPVLPDSVTPCPGLSRHLRSRSSAEGMLSLPTLMSQEDRKPTQQQPVHCRCWGSAREPGARGVWAEPGALPWGRAGYPGWHSTSSHPHRIELLSIQTLPPAQHRSWCSLQATLPKTTGVT